MARYRYTYSSVAEADGQMLNQLESVLAKHEIDGDVANAVMLTTSEAFTNALTHGNGLDPDKMITVEIEIDGTKVKICVTDEGEGGTGFSRGRAVPDPMAESGRGINLMEHFAEKVKFSSTRAGGLKVSAIFNRQEDYKKSLHN